MNNQKKFLKKKKREEVVRNKQLKVRAALVKEKKEVRMMRARHDAEIKLKEGTQEPILNSPEAIQRREMMKKEKIHQQLNRNLQILKMLEEEYEKEMAFKKELNDKLEAEGCLTLEDKINYFNEKNKQNSEIEKQVPENCEIIL